MRRYTSRPKSRRLWTVVHADPNDVAGFGVVHFETAEQAESFAAVHHGTVTEEDVPARIADRWVITHWGLS